MPSRGSVERRLPNMVELGMPNIVFSGGTKVDRLILS